MSRWTKWRKIAEGKDWFPDVIDRSGTACYELGFGGPRTRSAEPIYAGETGNERRRIFVTRAPDGTWSRQSA